MFSLIYVWINGWANNREAGDLRRCIAHYDVTVINITTELSLYGEIVSTDALTWSIFQSEKHSLEMREKRDGAIGIMDKKRQV